MKTKLFLNLITGEIVSAKNKLHAYKIFKADGKIFNYKTPFNKIVLWLSVQTSAKHLKQWQTEIKTPLNTTPRRKLKIGA